MLKRKRDTVWGGYTGGGVRSSRYVDVVEEWVWLWLKVGLRVRTDLLHDR